MRRLWAKYEWYVAQTPQGPRQTERLLRNRRRILSRILTLAGRIDLSAQVEARR